MGKIQLEAENKERDAAFNKAMHGKTAAQASGIATVLFKDPEAKKAALDEYFRHFDNKKAENETDADRKERTDNYATMTRQSVPPKPQAARHMQEPPNSLHEQPLTMQCEL